MAKTITPDQFAAQIRGILAEYEGDVQAHVEEVTQKVAKEAAKAVKSAARSAVNGKKYASGWTSQVEVGRLSTQGVVYNKKLPGLPHLLEHGHANRNGGRTPGREHIKPEEEQIIKEFESEVRNGL